MKYIDLHCDTVLNLIGGNKGLRENKGQGVDLVGLKKSEGIGQCFAIWLPDDEEINSLDIPKEIIPNNKFSDMDFIEKAFNKLSYEIEKNRDLISWGRNSKEIEKNLNEDLISAILTMEDGRAIDNDLKNIDKFYNMGVRIIGLTWNYENCIGYPNSNNKNIMEKGLKEFGKEAIEYMNYLDIIPDVSHLSDGGFWDLAEISKKPIIATHSNCRALTKHSRNLTDEMIKAIGNSGGVIGVNFTPVFLDNSKEPVASVDNIITHLNHMKNKGGLDIVALGTDLDGTWGNMEISRSENMQLLFKGLERNGWKEKEIEKFGYKNALRILE